MTGAMSARGAMPASGAKKVMVFGTFDGLHAGHLSLFRQAKKFGDCLIVVVSRDANCRLIKGQNPRFSERQRLGSVKATKACQKAILGQIRDPYAVIRREKPEIIALGYDQHSFDGRLGKMFPGVKVIRLKPHKAKIYKSSIINKKI